jgi:hypothetical protein
MTIMGKDQSAAGTGRANGIGSFRLLLEGLQRWADGHWIFRGVVQILIALGEVSERLRKPPTDFVERWRRSGQPSGMHDWLEQGPAARNRFIPNGDGIPKIAAIIVDLAENLFPPSQVDLSGA